MYKYYDFNNAGRNDIFYISVFFRGQLMTTLSILLIKTPLPRGIVPSHRAFIFCDTDEQRVKHSYTGQSMDE